MKRTISKTKTLGSSDNRTKLGETFSICPLCLKVIKAELIEEEGKVFLEKRHCNTKSKVLKENDVEFYKKTRLKFGYEDLFPEPEEGIKFREAQLEMVKQSGQAYLCLTQECNLDCPICFEGEHKDKHIRFSRIKKLVKELPAEAYCLVGAEPTMYPKLFETIRYLDKKGKHTYLITNGLKLAARDYVEKLKEAGLERVSLSFDGFDDKIYKRLRGEPLLDTKMKILKNLKETNMPTTLCCVVSKEFKEDQVPSVLKYAKENRDFISQVWFGALNKEEDTEISSSDILKIIEKEFDIPIEYVIEERKFRYLVYKLAGKFFGKEGYRKFSVINQPSVYLTVEEGRLKPLFNLKELREMNRVLDDSLNYGKISSILNLLINFREFLKEGFRKPLFSLLKGFFSPAKGSEYLNKENIIRLRLSRGGGEPYLVDLRRYGPEIPVGMVKGAPQLRSP